MKINNYINFICVAALLASTSCGNAGEPRQPDEQQYGLLSTGSLQIDAKVTGTPFSRASIEDILFVMEIQKDGITVQETEFRDNDIIEVPVGLGYTATVHCAEAEEAAFEAPYYEGETEATFDIDNNRITELPVIRCQMKNIKVSVVITDRLSEVLGSARVRVGYEDSATRLTFRTTHFYDFNDEGAYDGNSGYFTFKVDGKLVAQFSGTVNGNEVTSTLYCEDLAQGEHRILYYGLKDETGDDPQLTEIASHESRSVRESAVVEFESLKK